ncbi:MAG: tetratricopeptide repeat protein [Streptomyces sp.]|nr:tetratricopeptide repeat protein [Streptomyces sp.]
MSAAGGSATAGRDVEIRAEGDGSVAAQWIGTVHVHPAAREEVPRHVVGSVPPLAGSFQDRAERSRLRNAATGAGTVVLCQVLTGMGGVGKTQLAADYAHEAWNDGADLVVWVTASSRDAIVAIFAQAGVTVCGADSSDPQQAARTFLAWLHGAGRRWLVVLDDVADPADMSGLWPPAVPNGRTVVTTRRRDAALISSGRQRVEVGVFAPAEAEAYLACVLATDGRTEPPEELARLTSQLGFLPLALSQAAAYLVDAGIGAGAYRELLTSRARSLTEISPDSLPDDQTHTVAAAWELSVDYADRLRPEGLARPMLQLVAFLAPNTIPMTVLTSEAALEYLAMYRTPAGAGAGAGPGTEPGPGGRVTPQDAVGALRALHRLSLLTAPSPEPARDAGDAPWAGRMVRVHQVVQRATRDTLTPGHYANTAWAAGYALLDVWPEIERDTALAQALRACTTTLIAATVEGTPHAAVLYQPEPHVVLNRFVRSLGESGQVTYALGHCFEILETISHYHGPDHPAALLTRQNFARWLGRSGDAATAAAVTAKLLTDQTRVLGPDHHHTLATRHDLAYWRGLAGDQAGAVAAYAELLEDQLRVLGPHHHLTFATRSNLAYWRGLAGDPADTSTALAELLADQSRVLGPDHPDTLTTRHDLAHCLGKAGDPVKAAAMLTELLEDQVRVLELDHPDTVRVRRELVL